MPPGHGSRARLLSAIALVSGLYDVALGLILVLGRPLLQTWCGVDAPVPPIHADLNALFLVAIGLGYALPWRDPVAYRGYLWVMGPFLKGLGALAFVADHLVRHSPSAYLLFALTDGTLAIVTWVGLRRPKAGGGRPGA